MANDCGWPGVGFGGPPPGWKSPCADVKSGVQAPKGPDDGTGGLSNPSLWGDPPAGNTPSTPPSSSPPDNGPAAPAGDDVKIGSGDGDGDGGSFNTAALSDSGLGDGGDGGNVGDGGGQDNQTETA